MAAAIAVPLIATALSAEAEAAEAPRVLADYTLSSWTAKNGLPSKAVSALVQDSEGFLWIGTDAGLVRFDGVRFHVWPQSGTTALLAAPVKVLRIFGDHSMWIGFGGRGGVSRIANEHVQNYGEREGLFGAMTALVEDRDGTVWAGSGSGLFRLSGDRWHAVTPDSGLPREPVYAAIVDRHGTLFVSTSTAVFRLDRQRKTFQPVDAMAGARAISDGPFGALWVTDAVIGFRQLGETEAPAFPVEQGWGTRLLPDRSNNLWVGTGGEGLWRVRQLSGNNLSIEKMTMLSGLLSDGILALFEDRDGIIWIGTTEGLQRLLPHKVRAMTDLGLVRGIETTTNGNIWISTVDGLIRFPDGVLEHRVDLRQTHGWRQRVSAVHAEGRNLWVATDRGLLRIVSGNPVSVALSSDSGPMRRIYSITGDSDSGLWLFDLDKGLFRWYGHQLEPIALQPELQETQLVFMWHDHRGARVWLGFSGGQIATVDSDRRLRIFGIKDGLSAGIYYTIYTDRDGCVWLGGSNGLTRFADNTFTTLVTSADFPAGRVTAIVEDDDGILWVGTGSGILRIEKAEFDRSAVNSSHQIRYRMYDRSNGLAGFPLAPTLLGGNRGAIRAPDGRLWFLTMRGVTFVDPRAFREAPRPAPVHIQTVSVDGQPLHSPLQTRLPAGSRKLEIDYGLLDLTTPSSTEFRYRLEGFESDWTHAGTRQQAFYTDLAPGRYRFHVVSNNDDGVWAEPGATWEFSVTPMFYQTTWFYVAIGLNVALALWASWRFHLRRVKKEFALILGERTRLSREIHDTLLQSLVGVALQCEALADGLDPSPDAARQQLVRMRRQVEEYIREARQSIWNLRSAKLETTDLVEALREAGQQAAEGRGVDFTLSVHGTPQPCSRKLHNELFRIGQEATLNAIRHAQANQVRMVLEYDHDSVALRVSDDGCGFDPASFAPDDHYGLEGMKERAKNVGGKLKIMSKVGRGTEIETVVPIHTSS